MATVESIERDELAQQIARTAEQFRMRAAAERDFRAASYYLSLERLRVKWEAGLYSGEPLEAGDRR